MPRRKPSAVALNGFTRCKKCDGFRTIGRWSCPKCGGNGIKETTCVPTNPRPVEPAGRRA